MHAFRLIRRHFIFTKMPNVCKHKTKRSWPDSDVIRYQVTTTGFCISYWYQFRSGIPDSDLAAVMKKPYTLRPCLSSGIALLYAYVVCKLDSIHLYDDVTHIPEKYRIFNGGLVYNFTVIRVCFKRPYNNLT